MATFTSGRYGGGSYGPRISLTWDHLSSDIANNRSRVRLTAKLIASHSISFGGSQSGVLNGSGFTYSGGMRSPGTVTLASRDIWVNHNSDGNKTVTFSASLNLKITYSGGWVGNMTVSGSATMPSIPRASTVSSVSLASSLKPNTANTLYYTISRKHSAYRHQIQFYYGDTRVGYWDNVSSDGSSSLSLSTSQVNEMINAYPNTTTVPIRIRIGTRESSGGNFIGSASSATTNARISSTVIPTTPSISVSIAGNGPDKTPLNQYVQNKTKVTASFTASAGYGARISSERIYVRRVSGGSDSQIISGRSGTTPREVRLSGEYEAYAIVTDSRGATNNNKVTFTVQPYSRPTVTKFTADRLDGTPTVVSGVREGTWSSLGGKNRVTITVKKNIVGGLQTTVKTDTSVSTTDKFSGSFSSAGNSISSTYEFELLVTDLFGETSMANTTVSTQKVVLDIHRNDGIGIGKMHEKGELDVAGDVYFEGNIDLTPKAGAGRPEFRMRSQDPSGHGYIEYYGPDNTRRAYIGIPSRSSSDLHIYNEQGGNINLSANMVRSNGYEIWTNGTISSGSGSAGSYVKFPDGTMICRGSIEFNLAGGRDQYYGLPSSFIDKNYSVSISLKNWSDSNVSRVSDMVPIANRGGQFYLLLPRAPASSGTIPIEFMAVGRWK